MKHTVPTNTQNNENQKSTKTAVSHYREKPEINIVNISVFLNDKRLCQILLIIAAYIKENQGENSTKTILQCHT